MTMRTETPHAAAPAPVEPPHAETVAALRALVMFRQADDALLARMFSEGWATTRTIPRDTQVDPPAGPADTLCLVVEGQLAIGVFAPQALRARGREQRDAARGEADGTLLPPGPLARTASRNLALFGPGEIFNPAALPPASDVESVVAFSLSSVRLVYLPARLLAWLAQSAPEIEALLRERLALTSARLRSITGIKHEILDFYLRHGVSVAGPSVRVRQLDLCIDCKQCEDACEHRHGARRLTLGGFELGLIDVVYSCRTCADARCLSPCEHDAIKRDPASGEIKIVEDRCIGCSLCALSCPYGAINMVNIAEPEMPSYSPAFKARLDKGHKLGFGPGKGRKAQARRIANKCDHCDGYADQACVSACPTGSLVEVAPATLFPERPAPKVRRGRLRLDVLPPSPFVEGLHIYDSGEARVRVRKLSRLLWFIGLGSFLAVFVEVALRWVRPAWSVSYQLLLLDGLDPRIAQMNVSYLAGTTLALTCGYVGTALMVLSMAYPLQRRFRWFSRTATNQFWLDVHLMTGIVGPLFIVLHSAMRLTTWVSIPFWSMVAIVVSGAIGRYLYTMIPSMSNRHDLSILEHRRHITELAAEHPAAGDTAYQIMEREAARSERAWEIGLIPLLLWVMVDDLRRMWARVRDRRALRRLAPRRIAHGIARRVDRVVFYERRKELAPRSRALLKSWKLVHIPFSLVLLVTMVVHIGLELHLF